MSNHHISSPLNLEGSSTSLDVDVHVKDIVMVGLCRLVESSTIAG